MGKTIEMTTYVTIGIHVVSEYGDGVNANYKAVEIDLGDDGEPGPWGNTYVRDDDGDGDWVDDFQAQGVAWPMVEAAIKGTPTPEGYDPSEVMENLNGDQLIDIVWAVLEGGNPIEVALEMMEANQEDQDDS